MRKDSTTAGKIKQEEGLRELKTPGFLRHYKKPANISLLGLVGRILSLLLLFWRSKNFIIPLGIIKKHVMAKMQVSTNFNLFFFQSCLCTLLSRVLLPYPWCVNNLVAFIGTNSLIEVRKFLVFLSWFNDTRLFLGNGYLSWSWVFNQYIKLDTWKQNLKTR